MSRRLGALLADTRALARARDTSDWIAKATIVLDSCHPKQREFAADPGRRVVALVGRGGGKTTGGRARFLLRMLSTPKARCLYIATTREQAAELMWGPLKDLIEKLGIQARFNETKLRCTFMKNGATLRLVGADNKREIDKLRGQPFHEVGIDEAASYPAQLLEHLVFRIIGPRLGDYGGSLWFIGTPGHILSGPFYDSSRPGSEIHRRWSDRDLPEFADWTGWSFHSWSLQDGGATVPVMARLWTEALLEKSTNAWGDEHPVWRREYLGQWSADNTECVYRYRAFLEDGAQWNQWDPERDKAGFAVLPPGDWQYAYGMDLGHHDPFALEVFAYQLIDPTKTLYHVYEFEKRGMYPRTIAELLLGEELNAEQPGGVFGKTGWPGGIVADLAGNGDAILAELQNVYGIRIEPAEKKNKSDSIELFNGDLIDGRIKILKGSRLAEQLLDLQWAVDDFGRVRENKGQRNDCSDAAIYARRVAQHLLAADAPAPVADRLSDYHRMGSPDEGAESSNTEFVDLLGETSFDQEFWGNS